ncbi:hypothetical protein Zm00014a_004258 [Zea mays]|uniref:Uncharacterized protein n=1 Tax=Zea mays TaxID=4577 RepID=A0A3L6ETR3_MAIZE|nr:hypothetical protein Zm00014a_004258 [Zea mays]
MCTNKRQI